MPKNQRTVPKPLKYKPDWPRAAKRWTAFWESQPVDRPCLAVRARQPTNLPPLRTPQSLQDRWLDPDYIADSWLHTLERTYFAGEAVPSGSFLLAGWTPGCGPKVRFAEATIYHPVTMSSIHGPINWHPGPDDPWTMQVAKILDRLLDMSGGKFIVEYTGQVPVNDLLMLLRGNIDFLVDLADDCDACVRRMKEMLPVWLESFEYLRGIVDARQGGCGHSWLGTWDADFYMATQSDMSCMVSAEMFDRYVMTELDLLGQRYERIWYHLDGPEAVRHLPTLLSRPYVRAIQYVAGKGNIPNGPKYVDLYRRVQSAGRCLDLSVPQENMEFLIRHLRPEGLLLRTRVATRDEADELVANAVKWCGTHVNENV